MGKHVKGLGSIIHRKDGRYSFKYMVTLPDGTRKRQEVYSRSLEEIKNIRAKELAAMYNGKPICHNGIKLSDYLADWIKIAPRLADSTRSNYWGTLTKHVLPYIGNVYLSSLTTKHISDIISIHFHNGGSVRVAYIIKNTLSSALRTAKSNGMVVDNVARYVELPEYRPKKKKILSQNEMEKFQKAIKHNKYYFFFEMYLTYGTRRGEALPLEWSDIDFEKKIIHITKQYTKVGKEYKVCPTKTRNSERELPLLPHIEQILKGLPNFSTSGPIITQDGELVKPSSINYEFNRIIKENNLTKVTLHSLRHFTATAFKRENISIKDAQMILGHSSPLTTMTWYQESTLEDKAKALEIHASTMKF